MLLKICLVLFVLTFYLSLLQPGVIAHGLDIHELEAEASDSHDKDNMKNNEDVWYSNHSIHLAGGILVVGFLIFALIKQSVTKEYKP